MALTREGKGLLKQLPSYTPIFRLTLSILILLSLAGSAPAGAQSGGLVEALRLEGGGAFGSLVWGDYDNDNDLDLLITGLSNSYTQNTLLLRNDGGTFSEIPSDFARSESSVAAWGDYDNDNFLDVLLIGYDRVVNGKLMALAKLYRNNQDGTFSEETRAAFQPVYDGAADWADIDKDGDLDVLLTGCQSGYAPNHCEPFTGLYRNDGQGRFTLLPTDLPQVGYSWVDWGDLEEDEDLDIVICGLSKEGPLAEIYINSGLYSDTGAAEFSKHTQFRAPLTGLVGVSRCTATWVDYDRNGGLELMITGNAGPDEGAGLRPETHFYDFTTGWVWERENTGFPGVWRSALSWGDYDNDGDPDLLMYGLTRDKIIHHIYRNPGLEGPFELVETLPAAIGMSAAWGDFDHDHTLDLAVTGLNGPHSTLIFANTAEPDNVPPETPTNLSALVSGKGPASVLLAWSAVQDGGNPAQRTDPTSITYNLRVGTTLRGSEIFSPMAHPTSGFLRLAVPGATFSNPKATLHNLAAGTYFWSVQAVDALYQGSPFSETRSFTIGPDLAQDDWDVTDEDDPETISVLANDSRDFGSLEIIAVSAPLHGRAEIQGNEIRYYPERDYFGADSFSYTTRAPGGEQDSAVVNLTVRPVNNDPPSAITFTPAGLKETDPAGTLAGSFSASDPDPGASFTYKLVNHSGCNSADNDRFSLSGSALLTRSALDADQQSEYAICVRVTDETGLSYTQPFIISVAAVNEHAPVFSGANPVRVTMSEDGSPVPFALTLTASDADAGTRLTWQVITPPAHGSANLDPAPTASGESKAVQYTPAADYAGADSFVIQVSDGEKMSQITVAVEVQPVNDPPTLAPVSDQHWMANSAEQRVPLREISAGPANEKQTVTITAVSDHPALLPHPRIEYTGGSEAVLIFHPIPEAYGTAQVTVTVSDGEASVKRTFQVLIQDWLRIYAPVIEIP